MGHYAKVLNGKVVKVIVAEASFFDVFEDNTPGKWVKTSYNTRGGIHYQPNTNTPSEDQSKALRKNYAGIGYAYDEIRDAFIPHRPYYGWKLNEDTCLWEAPVAYPEDGKIYKWSEEILNWEEVIIE